MTKKKISKETIIYCGPSFPGELQQFSVFKGGVPAHVNKLIEECSSVGKLFVEVNKLAETRANLNVSGKRENQLYNDILNYQKEVK